MDVNASDIGVEELLPHRGVMLRLDALLSVTDDGDDAVGRFVVAADDPFLEEDGCLAREALIESAAQVVAAAQGWRSYQQGQPPPHGMLIGVQDITYHRQVHAGDILHISTTKELQKKALVIARCVISEEASGETVADGTLKFYVEEREDHP